MSTILDDLSAQCGELLQGRGWTVATAESCTGGWVAQCLTSVAGSSAWFETGLVTYSNEAKQRLLQVPASFLNGPEAPGAVSLEVIRAMAEGTLIAANSNISVATSGVAGPTGGSTEKPVGTVWLGWAWRGEQYQEIRVEAELFHFTGDRKSVREQAVTEALRGLARLLAQA